MLSEPPGGTPEQILNHGRQRCITGKTEAKSRGTEATFLFSQKAVKGGRWQEKEGR
jgi:hypothetical protein